MGYEVDFLPVGEGQRSGDAIALRFGNLTGAPGQQRVVVIDGGFTDTGERLVQHIREHYGTDRVDLVVSTHPDADHAAGLEVLVDQMDVRALLMHLPWNHTYNIARMFRDGRVTDESVEYKIREALQDAKDLETISNRRGIPIYEPSAGMTAFSGTMTVLGPTLEYYDSLLPDFRCMPEARRRVDDHRAAKMIRRILEGVRTAVERVVENWGIETLRDTGDPTSAENNSSAILLFQIDGHGLVFTADAGIPALSNAATTLEAMGVGPSSIQFIQVPHHGSRRNVGPAVLNRLLGPVQTAQTMLRTAFVSASGDGLPKHPAKKVTNAFLRRGTAVYGGTGGKIWHHYNAPTRSDWGTLRQIPFYAEVDD